MVYIDEETNLGFIFGTNPASVEYDAQVSNEGQGGGGFGGGPRAGGAGRRGANVHGWFDALFYIAVTHAALGDIDQAFLWLERTREAIPWGLGMMITSPSLDPLRSDPRFASLTAEMGMDSWSRAAGQDLRRPAWRVSWRW